RRMARPPAPRTEGEQRGGGGGGRAADGAAEGPRRARQGGPLTAPGALATVVLGDSLRTRSGWAVRQGRPAHLRHGRSRAPPQRGGRREPKLPERGKVLLESASRGFVLGRHLPRRIFAPSLAPSSEPFDSVRGPPRRDPTIPH